VLTEASPQFQRALLTAINDASPEGILVVDGAGTIVSYNHQIVDLWQIPDDLMQGVAIGSAIGLLEDPLLAYVSEQAADPAAFRARVRELHYAPELSDHCELELKNGRTLERNSTALRGEHGQYLGRVWFYRDVTSVKKTQAQLEVLARQDSLTGAINRRYFDERANEEFSRADRELGVIAIVEFDLDHFKRINDRFGHAMGDEVLKVVSSICRAVLRGATLFARIGGEEFAVLLTQATREGALILAERLRAAVAEAGLHFANEEVATTISVGVAVRQAGGESVESCLRRADSAMYAAKSNGRNQVVLASESACAG